MINAARHRGPDGTGRLTWRNVALGHTRLAIVDLSERASQPMWSADQRLAIVYNGEVYNHVELRGELAALGHVFKTTSDTEVMLCAWQQWGEEALTRFNGMFAFALLDVAQKRLTCVRDRFGVKPFYWMQTGGAFTFASEIKQLLPLTAAREPNQQVLSDFLLTGIHDHGDATFFHGITQLAPGRLLTIDLDTGRRAERRWYSLATRLQGTAESSADEISALLRDAVRLRLRADVRVGTCLSGGVDSAVVATLAAQELAAATPAPFMAFTAVSEDPAIDESERARGVAANARLDWRTVLPTYDDFAAVVDDVHRCQDEPLASSSPVLQWFVMKSARAAGVSVLLDGQGADEILLGYGRHVPALIADAWRAGGAVGALAVTRGLCGGNHDQSLTTAFGYALAGRCLAVRSAASRRRARPLAGVSLAAPYCAYAAACFDPARLSTVEIEHTSLPMLLRYEDRNSMAHSVEARLPYLDYRVVERAVRLPAGARAAGGWSKRPLRELATHHHVPDAVAWQRRKVAFEGPESAWMGKHRGRALERVRNARVLAQFVSPQRLVDAWDALERKVRWRCFSVATWEATRLAAQ